MADGVSAFELGRRLVAEVAPEELPLFEQTWEALGRRPRRRSRRREEPLGFGFPETGEVLVTAVVSGVVSTVLADLGRGFGSWTVRLLRRLRRRPASTMPEPLPPLPARRLAEIRRRAYRKARKFGLSAAKANALADALVSELATSSKHP